MYDPPVTVSFTRRKLPHWRVARRPYFVTFRLHGTLPKQVVEELKAERKRLLAAKAPASEMRAFERREFMRIEAILDSVDNTIRHLAHESIAAMTLDSFRFLEGQSGWLFPHVVIMPNHVHCLACRQDEALISLDLALGSLKKHTALEGNKMLGRHGKFWAEENYDYWCRRYDSVLRVREYIRNNPVKAGLVADWRGWKWLRIDESA